MWRRSSQATVAMIAIASVSPSRMAAMRSWISWSVQEVSEDEKAMGGESIKGRRPTVKRVYGRRDSGGPAGCVIDSGAGLAIFSWKRIRLGNVNCDCLGFAQVSKFGMPAKKDASDSF